MNDSRPPPRPGADDDWLDATLRDDGREHRAVYINDDGFTARVMARCPPRRRRCPRGASRP